MVDQAVVVDESPHVVVDSEESTVLEFSVNVQLRCGGDKADQLPMYEVSEMKKF